MHRNRHILDTKKDDLKQMVLEMSEMTSESLRKSLQCFRHCDRRDAEAIILNDERINEYYSRAERGGFYTIASQQPVSHDLREIVASMRTANELERIADHAANIARIRLEITADDLDQTCVSNIGKLGQEVQSMLDLAVAAYSDLDINAAEKLRTLETRIDQVTATLTQDLFDCMKSNPGLIEDGSRMLWIVHTLERIADRTTNIAEQVIYAVTAQEEKMN